MKEKHFVLMFALLAGIALASAQTPADISLDLRADTFYVHPGETFDITLDLYNPMPAGDSIVDRIDVYLLDLKESGFTVVSWSKNGWNHEFLQKFGDDQFWIANATSQGLTVTVKAESNAKTAELLGFYSFSKTSGTPYLKDHSEFKIKANVVPAGQQIQPPAKTVIPQKEQDLNNMVMALTVIIIVLICALAFVLFRQSRQEQHAGKFVHKKK